MATDRNIDQALAHISNLQTANGVYSQQDPTLVNQWLSGTYGDITDAQRQRLESGLSAFNSGNAMTAWNPGYQQFSFSNTNPLANGGSISMYDNPYNYDPNYTGSFAPGQYGRQFNAGGFTGGYNTNTGGASSTGVQGNPSFGNSNAVAPISGSTSRTRSPYNPASAIPASWGVGNTVKPPATSDPYAKIGTNFAGQSTPYQAPLNNHGQTTNPNWVNPNPAWNIVNAVQNGWNSGAGLGSGNTGYSNPNPASDIVHQVQLGWNGGAGNSGQGTPPSTTSNNFQTYYNNGYKPDASMNSLDKPGTTFAANSTGFGGGSGFGRGANNTPATGSTNNVLNTGSGSTYNPTQWQPTRTGDNPFLDSSGGFSYSYLPGMYNYSENMLANNASNNIGTTDALSSYLNNQLTSGYPGGMSAYLQQMVNTLGSPQANYGSTQQAAAAGTAGNLASGTVPQTALQNQVGDTISSMLSGSGLTDEYVAAMRQSVLEPSQLNLQGQLSRMTQGAAAPSSGLLQELQRRNESDFNNQLIKSGYENYNNLLTQGQNAGAQGYNQGLNLATLQGNLGNSAISNSLSAMGQGGNLLNNYLSAGNTALGNQQGYTSNATGQYGNLAQNLLGNQTYLQGQQMAADAQNNSTMGAGLAALLQYLASMRRQTQNPNPGTEDPSPSQRPPLTRRRTSDPTQTPTTTTTTPSTPPYNPNEEGIGPGVYGTPGWSGNLGGNDTTGTTNNVSQTTTYINPLTGLPFGYDSSQYIGYQDPFTTFDSGFGPQDLFANNQAASGYTIPYSDPSSPYYNPEAAAWLESMGLW